MSISPFVRINSVFFEKGRLGFEQDQHFRGKEENGELIDLPVTVESPAETGLCSKYK
jgi:hypothetical protein